MRKRIVPRPQPPVSSQSVRQPAASCQQQAVQQLRRDHWEQWQGLMDATDQQMSQVHPELHVLAAAAAAAARLLHPGASVARCPAQQHAPRPAQDGASQWRVRQQLTSPAVENCMISNY